MSRQSSGWAASIGVMAFVLGAPAHAALLNFESVVCEEPPQACGNGLRIHGSVGDIPGQLDVVYTNRIAAGDSDPFTTNLSGIRWFDSGYGDLEGVLWARGDNGVGEIALLPSTGFQVSLGSFDLGSFYDDTATQYSIFDGNYNLLASSGALALDAFGAGGRIHYHYDFELTSASGLIIQWGPEASNVAIDNLAFEVTAVPAPAALPLLATGTAGLVAWRRKQVAA